MLSRYQRYIAHKNNARYRGIAWELSYSQWRMIWARSGHWHKRGTSKGKYVMARYGDIGPYSVANVKIITHSANCSEGHLGKHRSYSTKRKISNAAKRVGSDTEERKRRSERAKKQHQQGKFGRATWKTEAEVVDEKISNTLKRNKKNSKRLQSHIASQSSKEMSRRSYQRKIFQSSGGTP